MSANQLRAAVRAFMASLNQSESLFRAILAKSRGLHAEQITRELLRLASEAGKPFGLAGSQVIEQAMLAGEDEARAPSEGATVHEGKTAKKGMHEQPAYALVDNADGSVDLQSATSGASVARVFRGSDDHTASQLAQLFAAGPELLYALARAWSFARGIDTKEARTLRRLIGGVYMQATDEEPPHL